MEYCITKSQLYQVSENCGNEAKEQRNGERASAITVVILAVAVPDLEAVGSCALNALQGSISNRTLSDRSHVIIFLIVNFLFHLSAGRCILRAGDLVSLWV